MKTAILFLLSVFALCAQQSPLAVIQNEGTFDASVRDAINSNFLLMQTVPTANALKLQGITICSTPIPSDTQVLTYSAANSCWMAATGTGGGGSGTLASLIVTGTSQFGTASTAPTAWQLCDTNCANATVLASPATGPGLQESGTTVAVLGTTCTSAQKGTVNWVSDATSPSVGSTVAGSGAAYAQVNCNGAHWTVTGI